MRSGLLRHYITFQRETVSGTGDRGQATTAWAVVSGSSIVNASVETLSGRELEIARQVHPEADTKITCRWRPGIRETDRINFAGRLFNIGWINNIDQRNRYLELYCTEDRHAFAASGFSLGYGQGYD